MNRVAHTKAFCGAMKSFLCDKRLAEFNTDARQLLLLACTINPSDEKRKDRPRIIAIQIKGDFEFEGATDYQTWTYLFLRLSYRRISCWAI